MNKPRRPTLTAGALRGIAMALHLSESQMTDKWSNLTLQDYRDAKKFVEKYAKWKRSKK